MALTEEQKLRMEENRKKALEKRKQNQPSNPLAQVSNSAQKSSPANVKSFYPSSKDKPRSSSVSSVRLIEIERPNAF